MMIKKLNLYVILSIVSAIVVGSLITENSYFYINFIQPVGKIFMNFLKFIVAPCVFFNIILSIISLKNKEKIKEIGLKTISYFIFTTICAILLAFCLNSLFLDFYASNINHNLHNIENVNTIQSVIVSMFPSNIIEPFLKGSMTQIIFASIVLGMAIISVTNTSCEESIKNKIRFLSDVFNSLMMFFIKLSPIGIFSLMTPLFFGSNMELIKSLLILIIVIHIGYILQFIFVYFPILKLSSVKIKDFFDATMQAQIFAFCSNSSLATLPLSMKCIEKLNVRKEIKNFVLPLGNTINMDGAAIVETSILMFLLTYLKIDITFSTFILMIFSITLATIGASGIPCGGTVILCFVLPLFGIPLEYLGMMMGVAYVYGPASTNVNISGDIVGTLLIDKFTKL